MDLFDRVMELSRYGYFCGQILAILMLDTVGEENPGLVKAMGGLNGGVGFSQNCCGCMTGGACVISYFTGKGEDTGMDSPEHKPTARSINRLWGSLPDGLRMRSPPITAASIAGISQREIRPSAWNTARRSLRPPTKSAWRSWVRGD